VVRGKQRGKENGKKEGRRIKEMGKEKLLQMDWPGDGWAQEGVPRTSV
jgi:hypothetical protein